MVILYIVLEHVHKALLLASGDMLLFCGSSRDVYTVQ